MDIDSYQATLSFGGSKDFPTGGDPGAALEEAKAWVEREARAHFKAEGDDELETEDSEELPEERQEVGNILATGPDFVAEAPTTTLFVGASCGFEWH